MLERILYSSLLKINPEKRKVYDCFTFFNEIELLELRFNELYDHVDKFVLVEANKTFQSASKPLYFMEHQARFQPFLDKVIHVIVDDLPVSTDAMKNERHQRNSILRGLSSCQVYDVVIVSDVDEIPSISVINYYKENHLFGIKRLDQKLYYYFLNNLVNNAWRLAFMGSYGAIKNKDLDIIRKTKPNPKKTLPEAGWHFSFMGGIDSIIQKIEAFAHVELNTERYKERDWLLQCLQNGDDLFARKNQSYQWVTVDESFPQYIVHNLDYYKQLGWIR